MKEEQINLNGYATRNRSPKKKKQKRFAKWWRHRRPWQKGLFIGVIALFTAAVVGIVSIGLYGLHLLGLIKRDSDFDEKENWEIGFQSVIDENVFNVALFGVDAREKGDFEGRSDSIMILSVNKVTNTVKIISVMRDSLVPYEWNGKKGATKITEIYQLGGPVLAVKTLNTLYGLDIREYATVNFFGMADIIDAVGGIDCTITEDEIKASNTYNINAMIDEYCLYAKLPYSEYAVTQTGLQHLNGVQATAYARVRHGRNWKGTNDDFGRTERQRYVMQQLMDKALSMNVATYPGLINKLVPYVKTSLNKKQMLSLAYVLVGKPSMEQSRIPLDSYIIDADYRGTGASTVYYNYQYAGKVLRAYLYENILPEDYMAQNGVDRTGWYGASGATAPTDTSETTSSSPDNSGSVNQTSSDASSSSQPSDEPSVEPGDGDSPTAESP